jgi:hypothetical protein
VAIYISQNATPASCQGHWQRTFDPTLRSGRWTDAEDTRLHRAVAAHRPGGAARAPAGRGRTADACRERYVECLAPRAAARKGRWDAEEDTALRAAIGALGAGSWVAVAERVEGRSDAQVRRTVDCLSACFYTRLTCQAVPRALGKDRERGAPVGKAPEGGQSEDSAEATAAHDE